jgi:hypothetical protein
MNAAAVFVGLLFWGWVWGIWGTLLAVPMLMVVKAVCDRVEDLQPSGVVGMTLPEGLVSTHTMPKVATRTASLDYVPVERRAATAASTNRPPSRFASGRCAP